MSHHNHQHQPLFAFQYQSVPDSFDDNQPNPYPLPRPLWHDRQNLAEPSPIFLAMDIDEEIEKETSAALLNTTESQLHGGPSRYDTTESQLHEGPSCYDTTESQLHGGPSCYVTWSRTESDRHSTRKISNIISFTPSSRSFVNTASKFFCHSAWMVLGIWVKLVRVLLGSAITRSTRVLWGYSCWNGFEFANEWGRELHPLKVRKDKKSWTRPSEHQFTNICRWRTLLYKMSPKPQLISTFQVLEYDRVPSNVRRPLCACRLLYILTLTCFLTLAAGTAVGLYFGLPHLQKQEAINKSGNDKSQF